MKKNKVVRGEEDKEKEEKSKSQKQNKGDKEKLQRERFFKEKKNHTTRKMEIRYI